MKIQFILKLSIYVHLFPVGQYSAPPFSAIVSSIHLLRLGLATSAYTPSKSASAQPAPQLTTPTRVCWSWSPSLTVIGPPLSPWQWSFPAAPAHSISSDI